MNMKLTRVKGVRKVYVACDEFKLSYTKGYGIIELMGRTVIDCSLARLLSYTNYKNKNELVNMLTKFMGE